jgi:hypothetical protein
MPPRRFDSFTFNYLGPFRFYLSLTKGREIIFSFLQRSGGDHCRHCYNASSDNFSTVLPKNIGIQLIDYPMSYFEVVNARIIQSLPY